MKPRHVRARFRGALLGAAIGDALGAAWPRLDASAWAEHAAFERTPHQLAATELTAMTTAVVSSLVERWGLDLERVRRLAAGYAAEGAAAARSGADALLVMPVSLVAYHDLEIVAWLAREAGTAAGVREAPHEAGVVFACAVALLFQQPVDAAFEPSVFLDALARHTAGTGAGMSVRAIQAAVLDQGREGVRHLAEGAASTHGAVQTALCAFLVGAQQPVWFPYPSQPCAFVATLRYALTLGGDRALLGALTGTLVGAQGGEQAIPAIWREQIPEARYLLELADAMADMAEISPPFRDVSYYMASPALRSLSYHVAG